MGGSSTPATSTTTVNNPGQQALYQLGLPFLQQFAQNPPSLPSGGTLAPVNPLQTQGQNQVLGAAAGPQQNLANIGASGAEFLGSGAALSPSSNPALQQTIDAAVKPLYQNLTESVNPAIRGAAEGAGSFGGTRQGIAEGLAAGRTAQAAGQTAAGIANTGYQSGLDAMVKNLGLLPNTINAQLAPGLTTSGVGDVQQQQAQAALGEQNLYEQYPQLLPLLMGQTISNIGSSFQPSGTTTTGTSSQSNPLMQGLGLGISGLGALGGGSGIAALLPFLGSDRRMKKNIRRIGQLRNGTPVYRFQYKHGTVDHIGFMSDTVPREAVIQILGYDFVNYARVLELAGERHGSW